ncbi:NAC domain-containing protein [Quillaja saponaria]|uniref:NAC domain-containing protein n=1 Tax=Quillaja saponaria TaxID=32244 RepID=A0AAD7LCV3_QUISA|nr:NAC domain-containing protein [Quillaja saponaria]
MADSENSNNDENCSGLTKNCDHGYDVDATDEVMCMISSTGNHCDWKSPVAPGYRFKPTDEELFYWYLLPKITGCQIRDGTVKDIDLYKYEPRHLTSLGFEHDDGRMYFFTPLHKKHKNGQRVERGTKKGFWKSTQKLKSIRVRSEHGSLVGLKTSLVYHRRSRKGGKSKKSNWLMQEFRLQGKATSKNHTQTTGPSSSNVFDNVVLCVVYKNEDKRKSNTDKNESSEGTESDQDLIAPSPNYCGLLTYPSSEGNESDQGSIAPSNYCRLVPYSSSEGSESDRGSVAPSPSLYANPNCDLVTYPRSESQSDQIHNFNPDNIIPESNQTQNSYHHNMIPQSNQTQNSNDHYNIPDFPLIHASQSGADFIDQYYQLAPVRPCYRPMYNLNEPYDPNHGDGSTSYDLEQQNLNR